MRIIGLSIGIALVAATAVSARADDTYRLRVLQKGIFEAETISYAPAGGARVQNARLVEATSNVPLRRNLRFGLRYVIAGETSAARRLVSVELVTRYPVPGLDQGAGVHRLESRRLLEITTGMVRYRDFQFIEDEELIPGKWVFEFWVGGQKIAEEVFCVFGPGDGHQPSSACLELSS